MSKLIVNNFSKLPIIKRASHHEKDAIMQILSIIKRIRPYTHPDFPFGCRRCLIAIMQNCIKELKIYFVIGGIAFLAEALSSGSFIIYDTVFTSV